mmetsp:Transcript_23612/g.38965  ORF Transcript_23612/g.38965 Transcript_23612/m.38965 type:complete len:84 (+) Transcript_23612:902-1153(+)
MTQRSRRQFRQNGLRRCQRSFRIAVLWSLYSAQARLASPSFLVYNLAKFDNAGLGGNEEVVRFIDWRRIAMGGHNFIEVWEIV